MPTTNASCPAGFTLTPYINSQGLPTTACVNAAGQTPEYLAQQAVMNAANTVAGMPYYLAAGALLLLLPGWWKVAAAPLALMGAVKGGGPL